MDRARRDRGHAGRARRTARRTLAVLTFEARMNTSSQNDSVQDIRGVLIQVGGARLLLPNATISEVLSYADPEPVENAPEWLLGRTPIGRAHVCTPVTHAHLVCRLLLAK